MKPPSKPLPQCTASVRFGSKADICAAIGYVRFTLHCDLMLAVRKQLPNCQRHWPMVQLQKSAGHRLGGVRSSKGKRLKCFAVISPGSTQAAKAPLALCKADAERICPGVAPGGGKIIACLKQHKDEVSVGCAKALKAMKTKMGT